MRHGTTMDARIIAAPGSTKHRAQDTADKVGQPRVFRDEDAHWVNRYKRFDRDVLHRRFNKIDHIKPLNNCFY